MAEGRRPRSDSRTRAKSEPHPEPRAPAESAPRPAAVPGPQAMSGDDLQFVVFRLGSQEFALSIFQVERILRFEPPAPLPNAPDFLEGVVPYGQGVVPLVDLRKRIGLPAEHVEETRVMVLQVEEQAVAVVVDMVVEVLRVDTRTITPSPPMVRGLAAEYISGIITRAGRTIVVLNAGRLLSSSERLALTEALT